MNTIADRTDIPILLIYDLDQSWIPREIERVQIKATTILSGLREVGHPVSAVQVNGQNLEQLLSDYDPNSWVVLNFCEEIPGFPHTAAQIAEIIEKKGFTHTGPLPSVLDFSQDKIKIKQLMDAHNIPTPRWHVYEFPELDDWSLFPALVKPPLEHCSIGLTREAVVMNRAEMLTRISYVLDSFRQPALVEEFIDGREFRISLWRKGSKIEMLPPSEMDYSHFKDVHERFLCYDSKMDPDSIYYQLIKAVIPASLTPEELRSVEQIAVDCFNLMDCRDYAGIDLRLRDGIFHVLEINPDPEITPDNSFTKSANLMGYSYGALCSHLVNLAAQRHPLFKNGG